DASTNSLYRGNVYVAWDTVGNHKQTMYVARSTDGGASFTAPVILDDSDAANIGIIPVIAQDGTIYALWSQYTRQSDALVLSISNNGGIAWSRPSRVALMQLHDVPKLRTGTGLGSIAIDRRTSTLYVVWEDKRFTKTNSQIAIAISKDKGQTWSQPK